ncbi:hypothetical protein MTY66_57690 [Mycolicibacterium sp. TY66]|nr:hypothetical protein MTY66_57690 [Mycolicibacterium sp. TY66]BCJ84236.1 hypothetical protein MTY81_56090 [Mycolicibacterium sp. TY81]
MTPNLRGNHAGDPLILGFRGQGDAMDYLAGQLVFLAIVAALIGGVIWAVVVMRKPRPRLEDEDDEL